MIETLYNSLLRANYALLRYRLRLEEDLHLPAYGLLRLRREFQRLLNGGDLSAAVTAELGPLLRPALPPDPVLRRRVQQPAPGFVLQVDDVAARRLRAGDSLELPVCFIDRALSAIPAFSQLLDTLGTVGLLARRGRYRLEAIEDDLATATTDLWRKGDFHPALRLGDFASCVDRPAAAGVRLEFLTPARLLKNGRPLFRPLFGEIFPFLLRRVTAVLAAWCGLEALFDVCWLLECVRQLDERENRLFWQDWRPADRNEEVGGVCGSIELTGAGLDEIWPLLLLGELLGLGKGAAYGAGRYRLHSL